MYARNSSIYTYSAMSFSCLFESNKASEYLLRPSQFPSEGKAHTLTSDFMHRIDHRLSTQLQMAMPSTPVVESATANSSTFRMQASSTIFNGTQDCLAFRRSVTIFSSSCGFVRITIEIITTYIRPICQRARVRLRLRLNDTSKELPDFNRCFYRGNSPYSVLDHCHDRGNSRALAEIGRGIGIFPCVVGVDDTQ
jgi:hypothetical protein